MIEYEFLKSNPDGWINALEDARATVNKESTGKEPSKKFKLSMVLAEHSVIRDIIVRWKWLKIPSFIATHFSRHKFEKYIMTQRNDRQNKYDRKKAPQDAPVNFTGVANGQNLIDAWRKRLCFQADPDTRKYAENFKVKLKDIEPELAWALCPNCIYRSGCCEPRENNNCHFYEKFLERHPEITAQTTITERYDIYNKEFYEKHNVLEEK